MFNVPCSKKHLISVRPSIHSINIDIQFLNNHLYQVLSREHLLNRPLSDSVSSSETYDEVLSASCGIDQKVRKLCEEEIVGMEKTIVTKSWIISLPPGSNDTPIGPRDWFRSSSPYITLSHGRYPLLVKIPTEG
jgi:hypothetical protein